MLQLTILFLGRPLIIFYCFQLYIENDLKNYWSIWEIIKVDENKKKVKVSGPRKKI